MSAGHGQLGLRSNLRGFRDLIEESACRKDAYLDIAGGLLVEDTWTADGDAWGVSWDHSFNGVPLDVVGVKTLTEVLTRVETKALCQATGGTYFYDYFSGSRTGSDVFVHLTDDVDPNDVAVELRTWFHFGTAGQSREHLTHPSLGADKLTDGDLEVWTSDTNLTNWTETLIGAGWSVNKDATDFYSGSFAARLESSGSAAGSALIKQTQACVAGRFYRVRVRYKTLDTNPSTSTLVLRFGASTYLGTDGRTDDSTDGLTLEKTGGQWRTAIFDLFSHETAPELALKLKNSAATACKAWIDEVRFYRINCWAYYEPRLKADGIPELEMTASDVFPGSEETGSGQIKIANDGTAYCERAFSAPFSFSMKPVRFWSGGVFVNGQEVLDLEPGGYMFLAGDKYLTVTDQEAILECEDYRSIMETALPPNVYTLAEFPALAEEDVGRRRAMLFGVKTNIKPVRLSGANPLLGTYEISDPTPRAGPTLDSIQAVYAYESEEFAEKKDANHRTTLVLSTDYTQDLTNGTITIILNGGSDPFILRVDATGYRDDASGTYTGSANAVIKKGPDILRFILGRVVDAARDLGANAIDNASFVAARTDCPQELGVYLGDDTITTQDFLDRLEVSGFADIVTSGAGTIFYNARATQSADGAPHLRDRDFLAFAGWLSADDVYGTVEVRYDRDPTTGEWLSASATSDGTALVQGRPHPRAFESWLIDGGDADDAVTQLQALAAAPIRQFEVACKGKLLQSKVGDLVLLTRDQALAGADEEPSLTDYEGRILSLKKNYLTHTCVAVVHTNLFA